MNFLPKIALFILLHFLISGCSKPDSSTIPKHLKELENLTVYSADAEPAYQIQLEREQIFGNTDSILIGRIQDVAVDSLGRVYIADIQKQVIHVFKPNGGLLRQLGRKGKGPGEFVILAKVQICNNRLYVFDPEQHKVSVFKLDTLAEDNTISLARNRGNYQALNRAFPWISNLYVRNDRTYLAEFTIDSTSQELKPWQNVEYKSFFYLLGKAGNISSKKLFSLDQTHTNVDGLIDNIKVFFGRPTTALSSNNNIYVFEESDHFLIKIYNPNGSYLRAFYYPHPNIPLTKNSASEGGITGTHFRHDFLLKHMESIHLPQNWPVLTELKIDDQDRLWIATSIEDMNVYEWWVLENTGELITKFEWPRNKPIDVVKNGKMYTRETDEETGLQQVVRYGIEMN